MPASAGEQQQTPNSVLVSEAVKEALPATKTQMQSEEVPEAKPQRSFKAIATLVLAAKRFQASLNPTYTYGKQGGTPAGPRHVRTPSPTNLDMDKPQEHFAYPDRGHKASILLKSLPELPKEAEK